MSEPTCRSCRWTKRSTFGLALPPNQFRHQLKLPGKLGFSYSGSKAYHAACCRTNLPLLSRRLQLPIPLSVDLQLSPGEYVLRRDVANRAVQTDTVVMLDVARHQTPCIVQRQRRSRPDALSLERAFDLSV
jgi:hypothetical protein